MKDGIIYIGKLSSKSVITFIKIIALSSVSTGFFSIIGIFLLINSSEATQSVRVSALPYVFSLFLSKPVSVTLFCGTLLASPFILFALCNKYITEKLIHTIITDKSEMIISPLMDKLSLFIKASAGSGMNESMNLSALRQKLKTLDGENRFIKKIVRYGFQKVKLDTIDFNKDGESVTEQIKERLFQTLKDVKKPSKKKIWFFIGFQWTVLFGLHLMPF